MADGSTPLSYPLFRRFLLGQTVSKTGDFVFYVALPWHIVLEGGGEGEIGAVMAALLTANLALAIFGGALVDRVSRKRVVVLSDVLQSISVAAAALLAFQGALSLPLLFLFTIVWGAAQAVAFPALGAFLPETVPKDQLQAANSIYQSATIAAGIAGPILAGLLVSAYGVWSAFAFDAAAFAVSATLLATVPAPAAPPSRREAGGLLSEIREGWSYVARTPWLWMGIAIFAVFNAAEASPRNVALPVLVGVDLGGGVPALGFVKAAFHAGWLVGAIALVRHAGFKRPGVVLYGLAGFVGLLVISVGLSTAVWQVAVAHFLQGIAFGVTGVIWSTSVGTYVDERLRGRVISIDSLGSISLMPVSAALSGAGAAAFGAAWLFLVGGVVVIACGAVGLASRRARTFEPADAGAPPP